jgi:hypothetical protein
VRRARPALVVVVTVLVVASVVIWRAWPTPTHRLSERAAAHACAAAASPHRAQVRDSYGMSVADLKTLDARLHGGAGAFLASLQENGGAAECTLGVEGSDLEPGCGIVGATFGLAAPDGSRFVPWCPQGLNH